MVHYVRGIVPRLRNQQQTKHALAKDMQLYVQGDVCTDDGFSGAPTGKLSATAAAPTLFLA